MSRLLVFIDPDNPEYADDAYNLNQAKIAVGSGELVGKGWGNATQSSGGFLPESATDFIFCVFAEQFGFVGAFILLVLYLALLMTALGIGLSSSDLFGSLIALVSWRVAVPDCRKHRAWTWGSCPSRAFPCRS